MAGRVSDRAASGGTSAGGGPLPADYVKAVLLSTGVAALPALAGDRAPLQEHLAVTAAMLAASVLVTLAAPIYQRWYRRMRRPETEERPLALPRSVDVRLD